MPKHLTSPSPSKKIRYSNGPARVKLNKVRKLKKHVKRQPNDRQGAGVLERL